MYHRKEKNAMDKKTMLLEQFKELCKDLTPEERETVHLALMYIRTKDAELLAQLPPDLRLLLMRPQ
ncbi:MAG: hypothetical protein II206_11055 [Bacteroidaceae bacterium]|nr:hypothetical protein [Bacteroidaceae bacterium]